MHMQGQRTLLVTQQQAWDALNDPAVLRACVPGCESFEPLGDCGYRAVTAIKIGPVSARFSADITLTDMDAPTSYRLSFQGQGGAAGFGNGQSVVRLSPAPNGCELGYTVEAQVGGKIAQLGQRLIDGVAKTMADDFFKRFEAQLMLRHPRAVADKNAIDFVASNPLNTLANAENTVRKILRDLSASPWGCVGAGLLGAAAMAVLLWVIA